MASVDGTSDEEPGTTAGEGPTKEIRWRRFRIKDRNMIYGDKEKSMTKRNGAVTKMLKIAQPT